MQVKFRTTRPGAIQPAYATPGSSGLDLHACIDHDTYLHPGVRYTCPTGIAIELPEGFEAQVRPRSGIAQKGGVTVLNTPGTVDEDFRGEIRVILINHGDEVFTIRPGDRIAQMVIAPVVRAELVRVGELGDTMRGEGGFGSTGIGHAEKVEFKRPCDTEGGAVE